MSSRRASRRRALERGAVHGVSAGDQVAGGELVSFAGLPMAVEGQTARELAELLEQPGAEERRGWGWPQYHHARRMQVPEELRQGVVVGAGHPTWCYELAAAYTLRHADEPIALVHGIVFERGAPFWHAWVSLPDGAMWDPTTGRFYEEASFRQVLQAVVVCAHQPADVDTQVTTTGQPGPWDACRRRHSAVVDGWLDQLAAEHPDLDRWITSMTEQEPGFAAAWEQLADLDGLGIIDALAWLANRPATWQHHPTGKPWPHLRDLQSDLSKLRTRREQ